MANANKSTGYIKEDWEIPSQKDSPDIFAPCDNSVDIEVDGISMQTDNDKGIKDNKSYVIIVDSSDEQKIETYPGGYSELVAGKAKINVSGR